MILEYKPGRTNQVADALSRRSWPHWSVKLLQQQAELRAHSFSGSKRSWRKILLRATYLASLEKGRRGWRMACSWRSGTACMCQRRQIYEDPFYKECHDTAWGTSNVGSIGATLLLAQYEGGLLCEYLFYLPAGQDWEISSSRSTRASTNPGATVGKSFFGFHCGIAKSGGLFSFLRSSETILLSLLKWKMRLDFLKKS